MSHKVAQNLQTPGGKLNSLTLSKNNNLKFCHTTDQVVLLETGANL